MVAEQRRELRQPTVIDGTFRLTNGRKQGNFMLTNHSRKGIRAALTRPLEPGSRIECEIHRPDASMPLFATGTVMWVKAKPVKRSFGFDAGIRLDTQDAFSRPQLQGYCFAPWRIRKIADFARKRGYFARQFPEQHRKPAYFGPALFFLYILFGALLSGIFPLWAAVYGASLAFAAVMLALSGMRLVSREFKGRSFIKQCGYWLSYCIGRPLASITYGWVFLAGWFGKGEGS